MIKIRIFSFHFHNIFMGITQLNSGKIRHWVCECAYHTQGTRQYMCKHGLASILLRCPNEKGVIGEIQRVARKHNLNV